MDAQFFVKYEARLCQKERISPNGHCVLYGGCTDRYGYGRMKVVIQGREISLTTHRLKYILVNKIKSLNDIGNSDISHLCHNKACLHADHLSLEPHEVNLSRRCCINIGICQHHHPYQDCLLNLRKTYMYILMHIKQKQILAFHLENKLCWTGTWLRNRGFAVQCPGHTACTATMDEADPLSERNIGQKIGDDLANSDLLVQYVTTDGDGRSAEGIQTALAKKHPTCKVERQADTTHLGQSQFRQTIQAKFSEGMFPGETTEKKKEQQKFLGMDIRNRCHAIMTTMHKMYAGDIHAIARRMPKVVETVLDCYSGDCSGCRYNGVTCGGGHRKNWWNQSMYLWRCGLTHFTINEGDRAVLKAILQLRLGVEALRLTKLNLNTNKNEAINRGLSVSLPKNVNFSRNARARASSTIHRLNNGAGVSLIKKLEAVQSSITKGGQVARCVRHFQTTSRYHMSHARTAVHKIKRKYNKIRQMQQYLRAKYLKRVKPDYEKGQLDPIIIAIDGCRANMGHRYELRKRGPFRIKHSDHPYHKPLHHL